MNADELRSAIEELYEVDASRLPDSAESTFRAFRDALGNGSVRAASPEPDGWRVNAWVKKGLLVGFRLGRTVRLEDAGPLGFVDKHTLPARRFEDTDGVRVVPGGSAIREGAYVGRDVICMPPMYVNVGAYVDDGALIDSHALVGSCAQVGKRVHVSAGAQIGGVLEPIGALPVIVEDDALIGGNAGIFEGALIGREAVVAAGTILTRSTKVYDLVNETTLSADAESPLMIPPRAVVVPGSRPANGEFAAAEGLHVYCPLIVKYRDGRTDAATELEDLLRS